MLKRVPHGPVENDNLGLIDQALTAMVVRNVPPISLRLGDRELGLVGPARGLKDLDPESSYGRRMAFAKFVRTLQLVDDILGTEVDIAAFNELVHTRKFYVSLAAMPLRQAVQTTEQVLLAEIVGVELSPFNTSQPAVIVQGTSMSTAMLSSGAELLTTRIPSSYDVDVARPLPLI